MDEREPFRDQVLAVVHDEYPSEIQLDVVEPLASLEHLHRSTLGNKEDGTELHRTFNLEMFHSQVLLPVVRNALVKGGVLIIGDLGRIAHPDGIGLVEKLEAFFGLL